MDYQKKYEAALELARRYYNENNRSEFLQDIFPELADSPYEITRKAIRDFILYRAGHLLDEVTEHQFIVWLEARKEKKEVEK